jgi:DNA modification methylase/predicted RNA-binding Zn-ribbon protein involved in translation (DUF1610 family)
MKRRTARKSLQPELASILPASAPQPSQQDDPLADLRRPLTKDDLDKVRHIEGFPIGADEDIIALSDPPYYTACPNPFLQDFIRAYGKPYDEATDTYRREPFAADVSEGKNDSVYNAHAYHTKVPPGAIEQLISHYTESGDIVLDCFAGSGMAGMAAARQNRASILVELSPAATAISDGYVHSSGELMNSAKTDQVLRDMREEWGWLYRTAHTGWDAGIRDPKLRRNKLQKSDPIYGEIQFTVWSDVFVCPNCGSDVVYWDAAVSFENEEALPEFPCPTCRSLLGKRNLDRHWESYYDPSLETVRQRPVRKPVLINYEVSGRRFEKIPDAEDLDILRRAFEVGYVPYPPTKMLHREGRWGDQWREGYHSTVTHAHDFLFERNSIILGEVWRRVHALRDLRFWFTATLPWCTRENRLHLGNYFGRSGGVITSLRGTLYLASLSVETNPLARFALRADSSALPHCVGGRKVIISTQSATRLEAIPDDSIDYYFIDPPFGDNLMYSELNFQWEAWLRVFTNQEPEAIVSTTQQKSLTDYADLIRRAFSEVYRVLKPGRWMTVEFHNSRNRVWIAIQEALERAGFVVADVRVLDKGKGSFNAVLAAGAVKKDLVISAYKPSSSFEKRFRLEAGTDQGAWDFVRQHLNHLPVFVEKNAAVEIIAERQNYLLFDRMVAFHIQRGVSVPLSASEFYAGLRQRFPERDGMYFTPEQVAEYDAKRAQVAQVEQLSLFVSDEKSAVQWLRVELERAAQTYQDIQPKFLQELHQARHEKLPELAQLLAENFLKDDQDRWYVPDPARGQDLEKLREKGLLKEFATYQESKGKLKTFRTEAVRAGWKAAWAKRDYTTIIEVARRLPEEVLQEDPALLMYYDNAGMRSGG